MTKRISHWLWCVSYDLEERRQMHASNGNINRQVACSVALFMLRMLGVAL